MLLLIFLFLPFVLSEEIKFKNKTYNITLTPKGRCFYKGRNGDLKISTSHCTNFTWVRDSQNEEFFSSSSDLEGNFLENSTTNFSLPEGKNSCLLIENFPLDQRRLSLNDKYIGVGIVTDNLRLKFVGGDLKLLDSTTTNIIMMLQDIMEELEPGVKVELRNVYHAHGQDLPWEKDGLSPEGVLSAFYSWSKGESRLAQYNTLLLLTGQPLTGSVIGIATLSSYCIGGVAIVESLSSTPAIAKTAAHELAHTLGVRHTNNYLSGTSLPTAESISDCITQYSSVMSPIIFGTSYLWDRCSKEWFKLFNLGFPYGCSSCTYYPSFTPSCFTSRVSSCGNGVLDQGEECEGEVCCSNCKIQGECSPSISPCCNPSTCTPYPPSAKKQCSPSPCGSFCSGGGECPITPNYTPCNDEKGEGWCFKNECVSQERSCLAYKDVSRYDIKGGCPRQGEVCDRLYCVYGELGFCTPYITPGTLPVKEGSKCGEGKACISGECTPVILHPTAQPTYQPTSQPGYSPTKYRKRCVWRGAKRVCRWKKGEKPV